MLCVMGVAWCGLGCLLGRGGYAVCDGCSMVGHAVLWVGAGMLCLSVGGDEVGMMGSIGGQWARGGG